MEPFSSCVAVGFDVVQDKDGLHDRGRAAGGQQRILVRNLPPRSVSVGTCRDGC